jgi:hypothetical protein
LLLTMACAAADPVHIFLSNRHWISTICRKSVNENKIKLNSKSCCCRISHSNKAIIDTNFGSLRTKLNCE